MFQPSGLPILDQGQRNATARPHYVEGTLPRNYYTNTPPGAQACFSTQGGQRPLRLLYHVAPGLRNVHSWNLEEIQSVCRSIRRKYLPFIKNMAPPTTWEHLFYWFDAHDLYYCGAMNLWKVINHLLLENWLINHQAESEKLRLVGQWVDDWMMVETNRVKLLYWNKNLPVLRLMAWHDFQSLGHVDKFMEDALTVTLKDRQKLILRNGLAQDSPVIACGSSRSPSEKTNSCASSPPLKQATPHSFARGRSLSLPPSLQTRSPRLLVA